jgi:hypothetical protein
MSKKHAQVEFCPDQKRHPSQQEQRGYNSFEIERQVVSVAGARLLSALFFAGPWCAVNNGGGCEGEHTRCSDEYANKLDQIDIFHVRILPAIGMASGIAYRNPIIGL